MPMKSGILTSLTTHGHGDRISPLLGRSAILRRLFRQSPGRSAGFRIRHEDHLGDSAFRFHREWLSCLAGPAWGGRIGDMAGVIREFEGLRVKVDDVVYMPSLDAPP